MNIFMKLPLLLLLFISFTLSCSNSDDILVKPNREDVTEEPDINDVVGGNIVSVSVSQTTIALIEGKDVEIPFSVDLRRLAKSDVNIKLNVTASCEEGSQYVLGGGTSLIIKAGEKQYKGLVTFKSNGFEVEYKGNINIKLETEDVAIDTKKAEFTITVEKPSLYRPGITYAIPTVSYACSAYCSRYSIGGIVFEKLFENQYVDYGDGKRRNPTVYEDLTSQYVACVTLGENKMLIETDRASANASWRTYKYKIALWGDWNGDGDFEDEGEQCVSESWTQGPDQYIVHELKFNVPEDAVKSSVIRMGIYADAGKTSNMRYGAGNMEDGNMKDISYLLVDTPVVLKPLEEADKPVFSKYCKTVEFFYSYAEIRTFQLNGETILESSKGDPLETDIENKDHTWDAWGLCDKTKKYTQKLKRGVQNVFEFTAERHIDFDRCDQRYRAMIYVDWNGDNDFYDEGEEILQEEWFAEWLNKSQPKKFLGYLTPPADAVKSSRIRFGVYQNSQGYIKGGCGGGNNTDFIDILYELEN